MKNKTSDLNSIGFYLKQVLSLGKDLGPTNLEKLIRSMGSSYKIEFCEDIIGLITKHIEKCELNDSILDDLTLAIQKWDHNENPDWAQSTKKYTNERRGIILDHLGFSPTQQEILNKRILCFSETDTPIIIAEEHEPWYEERIKFIKPIYWNDYVGQLKLPKGTWDNDSISILDASIEDVLSRLSDPTASNVYPVKGLVVGYVQSGKTSHFNGLIAKAADAGYRLFIVLSGTTEILRKQTQRRIDKNIIGYDILPKEYGSDDDWPNFVKHEITVEDGRFEWERLTNKTEYKSLRNHPSLLDFQKRYPHKPFNDPENLKFANARIAIIKKVPVVIDKLINDLKSIHELKSKLDNVPTLIIDDESDQASINTIDQSKPGMVGDRTRTNKAIGDLLKLIPRAQYVGYTATPFANVFIDPDDADDLFPKDFIISLNRPQGYMGGSDFYDFEDEYEEGDYRSNKNAHIRFIEGEDEMISNLPSAIDSFVLSGAIKLYRQDKFPSRYKFQHHTMLLHHAAKQVIHDEDKQIVESIFNNGARYQTNEGLKNLELLFETDYSPVSLIRASSDPFPSNFEELRPYISKCISKLSINKTARIINCSTTGRIDEPDFEQSPVWAILIGGTKLSRGYTVEGLTISYYRRPTGAGDTLMQMGRWFGFRQGYKDLVRLYIGNKEKRGGSIIDLYQAFGAVVKSEEELRSELLKYSKTGLKPKQVPPLVSQVLPFLPPTSKNKMFNAIIKSKDYSGEYTEKVSPSIKIIDRRRNLELAKNLIDGSEFNTSTCQFSFTNFRGTNRSFNAFLGLAKGSDVLFFMENYLWINGKKSVYLETEFIKNMMKKGLFSDWQILIPQLATDSLRTFDKTKLGQIATVQRKLAFENTFDVYSEPRHREAAAYLAGVSNLLRQNSVLDKNRNQKMPIIILYFVIPKEKINTEITVGFGIQYPGVKRDFSMKWGIRDSNNANLIVIDHS